MKIIIKLALFLLISGTALAQNKKAVSVNEFEKGISEKKSIVVDVRRPDEFQQGHIKEAINANWQNQEEFIAKTSKLDKSKPVYVYCLAGTRSEKAVDYLLKNGFMQVIGLDGGIKAWNDAHKPIVKP